MLSAICHSFPRMHFTPVSLPLSRSRVVAHLHPLTPHADCAKLLHEEMAVMNGAADDALLRIWSTVAELSEQLSAHRSAAAELQARIGVLRVCGMLHLVLLGG
jgi:hypothetical protein